MAHLPSGFVSHSRKVCNIYKRVVRHIESVYIKFDECRIRSVVARAEFDKNKNIKDLRVAKDLLKKLEKQLLEESHYNYKQFAESPGGCAYQREHIPPDWVLDYWHPMEKAAYPKYFATREKRKVEFEEFYKKNYGSLPTDTNH